MFDVVVVEGDGVDIKVMILVDVVFVGVECIVILEGDGEEIGVNDLVLVEY